MLIIIWALLKCHFSVKYDSNYSEPIICPQKIYSRFNNKQKVDFFIHVTENFLISLTVF